MKSAFPKTLLALMLAAVMLLGSTAAFAASGEASAGTSEEVLEESSGEVLTESSGEVAADMKLIGLTGVSNARQLGGYETEDGRHVKENVLIRSGALSGATEEDLQILTEQYNVKLIVDLRSAADMERTPDPEFNDAVVVNVPVWDETLNAVSLTDFMAIQGEFSGEPGRADLEFYRRGIMGSDEQLYIKQTFQNDISLEGFRTFIDLLLEQEEGTGILYHCASGKDRTGSATVILLTLLGVDRETVLQDFAMTNEVLKEKLDQLVEQSAAYTDDEDELYAVRTMNGVNPEFMENMFDYAEQQSGSMLAYIQEVFGVTDEEVQILRDKYLE